MGVIKEFMLLPVAPLRFTVWVADHVADEAERKQYSPAAGVQQLERLEEARQKGELSEEEAAELESQIIEQQMARVEPAASGQEGANGG